MEDITNTQLAKISAQNDDLIGPQIDVVHPQAVEVKYNGTTLWVNVDGICRLRIGRAPASKVTWDVPGFTQREVQG